MAVAWMRLKIRWLLGVKPPVRRSKQSLVVVMFVNDGRKQSERMIIIVWHRNEGRDDAAPDLARIGETRPALFFSAAGTGSQNENRRRKESSNQSVAASDTITTGDLSSFYGVFHDTR